MTSDLIGVEAILGSTFNEMNNKDITRKNRILGLILAIIALIAGLGALIWFQMYAPLILQH